MNETDLKKKAEAAMIEAAMDAEYARDPYARARQAVENYKRMTPEERAAVARRAGTIGDDGKLTKYVGGTSELSEDYRPLPGETLPQNKKPKNNPAKKATSKPAASAAAKILQNPRVKKSATTAAGRALSQKPKEKKKARER